jgi:hypothetical protein
MIILVLQLLNRNIGLMKISTSSLIFATLNVSCAVVNAYLAPKSFALSFLVGAAAGWACGLKHRASFILLDANQKAVEKAQQMAAEHLGDTQASKYTYQAIDVLRPTLNEVSPLAKKAFSIFLAVSRYGQIISIASSYMTKFDEQRRELIKKLKFIPGWKGTALSLTALAANIGYISQPILTKIGLFSGFTPGYAIGMAIIRKSEVKLLENKSYRTFILDSEL